MMLRSMLPVLIFLSSAAASHPLELGDPVARRNGEGVRLLEQGEAESALEAFQAAQSEDPDSPRLHYNVGLALAQLGRMEEAARSFDLASAQADPSLRARSAYNAAWCRYRQGEASRDQQQIEQAIQRFTEALDLNRRALLKAPDDRDAKHNYEAAKQALEELRQEQQQQQDQNQEQNEEQQQQDDPQQDEQQQNQDSQQDQQQQDSREQEEQNDPRQQDAQKQQEQQRSNPQQQEQQRRQPQPREGLTEEQAARILNQLPEEDMRRFQRLFQNEDLLGRRFDKDW